MGISNVMYSAIDSVSLASTLGEWQDIQADMGVFALLPEAEKASLDILQAVCREKKIPLLGGIFPALLLNSEFVTNGVLLFRFANFPPAFVLPDLNQDEGNAGYRISTEVEAILSHPQVADQRPTLFLIFDSMLPTIDRMIDQLYLRLANRVRYVGVNAGSETFQPMPCLFDAEQVIGDGVLGMLLPENTLFSVEHGYTAPDKVMVASSSDNNRIFSIDWRPAFDVYQEIIYEEYAIALTRENFYNYAVHFPFGILRANGEVVVRIPVALTEDGSIYCIGEVPENSILALLRAPQAVDSRCVDRLLHDLQSASQHSTLMTFYCAGRHMHLGASSTEELAVLKHRSGASLVAGALSLGEMGSRISDYPVFHNAALVCKVWPTA